MAEAEADWTSTEGLTLLTEGLACVDDVLVAGGAAEARTARNLAATYASRFYARVRTSLAADAQVPEPALEHYFKVVLAFDQVREALPQTAADLKIAVVRTLIERYYEGHSPEQKRRALEQLEALGRGG